MTAFSLALLAGCASDASVDRGPVQGSEFHPGELLQSEGNRYTQAGMRANQASLLLLADKLYRRNPAEWRKSAAINYVQGIVAAPILAFLPVK